MSSTKKSFLFSIIMPVFNTERYLEEAIESIVGQTFSFEKNIQLILVNDGSTDKSATICQEYQMSYPENIIFIDQDNTGVSKARNKGLEKATGKYVNFLDSDDKWSLDAFEHFYSYFHKHPEMHIATAKHMFFGRKTSSHPLEFKYKEDRVIDVLKDYSYPHLSLSNTVLLKDLLKKEPFNGALEISEDFYVFNEIILKEHRYAVLSKPVYWYRKRNDSSSAIDLSSSKLSWYISTPKNCYQALFDLSKKIYGSVIPYIQFCVMYDMQWRIKTPTNHPLNNEQLDSYKAKIIGLLSEIDDDIIVRQKHLNRAEKIYTLSLKHGIVANEIIQSLSVKDGSLRWDRSNEKSAQLWNVKECNEIKIDFVEDDKGELLIEGRLPYPLPFDTIDLYAEETKGEKHQASLSTCYDKYLSGFFDKEYYYQILFKLRVPFRSFSIKLKIGSIDLTPNIKFGKFCPLSWGRFSYAEFKEHILTTCRPNRVLVKNKSRICIAVRETQYQTAQWLKHPESRPLLRLRRKAISFWGSNPNRQIWLISDRIVMAGDNGEALFTYLQSNPIENVDTFFVISKESKDYCRLKEVGPVLAYGSEQHKLMTLCASTIISSAGEDEVFNPFGSMRYLFRSVTRYKFVFLQHGVTKDDISSWLNRRNKNIKLFITAAHRERDSILHNPRYGYREPSIALTGFPRHDKLLSSATKKPTNLLIAPTWRQSLAPASLYDRETGLHAQNPFFSDSSYFLFYNKLINDERIERAASKHGIKVRFLIHPALTQEIPKFNSNYCEIISDYNYADEFINAAILITDYSSVAFDYALLKRPIVYAQFDEKNFFSGHLYSKGYFDYRDDGFGPVCEQYEDTVQCILRYLDNPCMKSIYAHRVDNFFFWPIESRCKLVADRIQNLHRDTEPPIANV